MNPTMAPAGTGAASLTLTAGFAGEPVIRMIRAGIRGVVLSRVALVALHKPRIPKRIVLPAAGACALLTARAGSGALRAVSAALLLTTAQLALVLLRPRALGMGELLAALLITIALGQTATTAILLGLGLTALTGVTLIVRDGAATLGCALPLAPFLTIGVLLALA